MLLLFWLNTLLLLRIVGAVIGIGVAGAVVVAATAAALC